MYELVQNIIVEGFPETVQFSLVKGHQMGNKTSAQCMHTHTHIHTHTHTHKHTNTHKCMDTHTHIYATHTYVCMSIHTYIMYTGNSPVKMCVSI